MSLLAVTSEGYRMITLVIGLAAALVVAALVAVCAPRARPALLAFGAGVLTHFSRDLATGGGVALLWPLSAHRVVVPYAVYVAALALLAVWAWRKGPRWQPGASMRTNGQPGPRP